MPENNNESYYGIFISIYADFTFDLCDYFSGIYFH